MDEMWRKLRGVTGVGLTWGVAWGVIGATVGALLAILSPDGWQGDNRVLGLGMGMAMYGVVAGAGFAKLLAVSERRKTLDEIPLPRMAAWGVAGSALVPLLFGALGMFEPGTTTRDVVEAMVMCGVLGGGFAAGSLALARRASEDEQPASLASGATAELAEPAMPTPLELGVRERRGGDRVSRPAGPARDPRGG